MALMLADVNLGLRRRNTRLDVVARRVKTTRSRKKGFAIMAQATPVWFITGCSTGFGRELAELVLARGWKAVVTAT